MCPPVSKDEWARAQYRAASMAGRTKEWFERTYAHSHMQVMDAHVDQIFWQMVRMELRSNPKFEQWLQFIESFYEMPQHEFLERIKKRFWAQMQPMTQDGKHRVFVNEVFRAYRAAKEQIEDVDPALDEQRAYQAQLLAKARQEAEWEWQWKEAEYYRALEEDE